MTIFISFIEALQNCVMVQVFRFLYFSSNYISSSQKRKENWLLFLLYIYYPILILYVFLHTGVAQSEWTLNYNLGGWYFFWSGWRTLTWISPLFSFFLVNLISLFLSPLELQLWSINVYSTLAAHSCC